MGIRNWLYTQLLLRGNWEKVCLNGDLNPGPQPHSLRLLTTIPPITCSDIDVKLGIYTATAEKSWEKVCLNGDLNSGPQLHSLRLWPPPYKYIAWMLMWNLAYIELLLRKAEKKFASTGIWTPALSFTVWGPDHYPTNSLHGCWYETWHIYSYCWEKLRKSLPQQGFELRPSASQSETLTTTPWIHCMDVDVKLAIYTATAEKSWEKVCLNGDLNSGPQLHSLRLWPPYYKYVAWILMCSTSTVVTSMSSSSFVWNIVTTACFIYRTLQ